MRGGLADVDPHQLRAAAVAGDAWAQLNLGAAYDHGIAGVAADAAQARIWYLAAAQQGVAEAQFNLAHCLATGHGGATDPVAARVWMRRAAVQGLADAQFLFGMMLYRGVGGGVERADAVVWLRRAAAQGQVDAVDYLEREGQSSPDGEFPNK